MKAGKEGPMRKNFSSAFRKEGDEAAKANKTIGAIKGNMSKAELRSWVIANNKGKGASDKSNMSQKTALGIWRAKQPDKVAVKKEPVVKKPVVEAKPVVKNKPVVKEKPVVKKKAVVEDTTPTTTRSMYGGNPTLQPGYLKNLKKKKKA